jgi:acetyl esterase/lipase
MPDHFVLVGHSAGAHLAALVSTDERWLAKYGLPLTLIAGVVSLDGGGYDLGRRTQGEPMSERVLGSVFTPDRNVWFDASPVNHVAAGKGIPPFLLFQAGDRDVSIEETAIFSEALTKAGLPFEVVHAADKTHRSIHRDFGTPDDAVMAKVLEFAHQVTNTPSPPTDPRPPADATTPPPTEPQTQPPEGAAATKPEGAK